MNLSLIVGVGVAGGFAFRVAGAVVAQLSAE